MAISARRTARKDSKDFSRAFLIVTPGITIKDRLRKKAAAGQGQLLWVWSTRATPADNKMPRLRFVGRLGPRDSNDCAPPPKPTFFGEALRESANAIYARWSLPWRTCMSSIFLSPHR
jgi:hypothetical protein